MPSAYIYTFNDFPVSAASLYVPEGSLEAYKAKGPWNSFGKIIALDDVLRGDLNGDGEVNMSDVMFLVQRILNGKFPNE